MTQTIFLTGATGQIGSALLARLLADGHHVVALVRDTTRIPPLQAEHAEVILGDVTQPHLGLDPRQARRLARHCDSVIHCAARTTFHDERGELYETNVGGTENVLRFAMETRRTRLDYFSTAYVCGRGDGAGFVNEYERTKCLAEQVVRRALHERRLTGKILRPSIVVGLSSGAPKQKDGLLRLIELLVSLEGAGGGADLPIRMSADPRARINFVSLEYVIESTMQLCFTPLGDGDLYHLADSEPPRNSELLRMLIEATGVRGLSIVPAEPETPNPLERRVTKLLSRYREYLFDFRTFTDTELETILNRERMPPPGLTPALLATLVQTARENHGTGLARSNRQPA